MSRRTKIVCTLGPAVDSRPKLKALIDAGMNVARINCSHGDWPTRKRWIQWIRELQPQVSPVGVLVDLSGPKFRIGEVKGGSLEIKTGETVCLAKKGKCQIPVTDPLVWSKIKAGTRVLLGDGGVELRVTRKGKTCECKAMYGGTVRSHQGLTVVGRSFAVPAFTQKDKSDLKEALKLGADFIALSYVRSAKDMKELRRLADKSTKLVAKIETKDGLKNIDEVIAASDVVMVARGDLGLQMDIEEVPMAQKRIIAKCNAAAIPVITATQMLESMLSSPCPTRAETTDVANAILDGTDAVMLSGETAAGQYPIEAVMTMAGIARKTERHFDHKEKMLRLASGRQHDEETDSVARAAVSIADNLRAKAVLTSSTSGTTPRLVSRYRPPMPVLCACWTKATTTQMSMIWGVQATFVELPEGTDEAVARTIDAFLRLGLVKRGDKVVVTAGVPAGVPGKTNMVLVRDV